MTAGAEIAAITDRIVEVPAMSFHSQDDFMTAFHAGDLHHHLAAVIRFQDPKANGMPELHKLSPLPGVLQDRSTRWHC